MNKTSKIIVFIVVIFVIGFTLAIIKEAGGGAVMWLGAVAIFVVYKSMFSGKNNNDEEKNNKNEIIKLDKD